MKVLRTLILTAIMVAGSTVSTAAQMSDDAFNARVRAFLLENPEVILEAMTELSEREAEITARAQIADFPELFQEPAHFGMGTPTASLRVVEFFDYRCAPCKEIHPALEALAQANPDLRIEMRHLPILTPGSDRAARFALATKEIAGNAAHEAVHKHLWTLRGPLNESSFKRISAEENLDWPQIKAAMNSDTVTARIDQNKDIAIALEILGTPAFVTPNSVNFGSSNIDELATEWLSQ